MRRRALAGVREIGRGPFEYPALLHPAAFGLLVIDGLLGARMAIGDEVHLELLGRGDFLRPWVHIDPEASVPAELCWEAFEETSVAVLDERFAAAVSPWPEVSAALMHRLVLRARHLTFQLAMVGVERIDERLLIALWHFADRWGRVTPEGVVVDLALTHSQMAEVVRAARPSLSTAVSELRRRGALSLTRGSGRWVLHGDPPPMVGCQPERPAERFLSTTAAMMSRKVTSRST